MIKLKTPLEQKTRESLKAGDLIFLSGKIFTARDAAHQRIDELLNRGEKLPFDLTNELIYYVGPTPLKPDGRIGSAGPTTATRMDCYTPKFLENFHLGGMIGKGDRSKEVIQALMKFKAVYFVATGGAGALLSKSIQSMKAILYEDLGPEAVFECVVIDFPLVVAIDCEGNNLYSLGPEHFKNKKI